MLWFALVEFAVYVIDGTIKFYIHRVKGGDSYLLIHSKAMLNIAPYRH